MISILFWIIAFIVAITIHEASHAWMANRLGDPTAKLANRLSLNPLVHLDPLGTLLPFILILTGSPLVFGWGKPTPVDPYNLKNPQRDMALVSIAGPISNLIMAILLAVVIHLVSPISIFYGVLYYVIIFNVSLAIFNLIPVYPLDGEKILAGLLPQKDAQEFENFMHRFGSIILILLIFPSFRGVSPLSTLISPVLNFVIKLLIN